MNTDFTTYDKTVDYSTYDVTGLVRAGSDALAVSLGNGFYAGGADDYPASGEPWQPAMPTLKLELQVWYADGTSAQVTERRLLEGHHRPHDRQLAGRRDIRRAAGEAGVDPGRLRRQRLGRRRGPARGEHDPLVLRDVAGRGLAVEHRQRGHHHRRAGTIYLRKTFTVTDPSTISSAILRDQRRRRRD